MSAHIRRFMVTSHGSSWSVYAVTSTDTRGELVATVYDKRTLELLIQAPALAQTAPHRPKTYKDDTLSRFSEAFAEILRKIK